MQPAEGTAPPPRRRLRRVLQALISLAIGWALLVGVLPRLADLGRVWEIVRSMTFLNTLVLVALAVWNLFGYAFVMMAALPGLRVHHSFLTGQVAAAVTNTVPAGSVVGIGVTYAVLSSYGHSAAPIAMAAVLSGWWNTLVVFGLPSIAALVLALQGAANRLLVSAAAVGLALLAGAIVVLVLVSTSERFARAVGRIGGRVVSWLRRLARKAPVTGWDEGFARFQRSSAVLIRRRWHWLTRRAHHPRRPGPGRGGPDGGTGAGGRRRRATGGGDRGCGPPVPGAHLPLPGDARGDLLPDLAAGSEASGRGRGGGCRAPLKRPFGTTYTGVFAQFGRP
ncbi:MAG: hypothetical protein MUE66_10370 [Acidimicrobiia bacterium]|nr:hypothetical protein [Acidimicrobiia bacterium]